MSSSRDFFEIVAIFALSLTLFTWGIGTQEVIGFESRFYLFALEMWQNGVRWFPTSYYEFYPDYPATSTFLIYIAACFLGGMSKLAAVLPSAIAASMTVVFTYLIGSQQSKRWGIYAVLLLLLTVTFFKSARSISLDMYTAMITTACFYLIHSANVKGRPTPGIFVYMLFLLGFAFRGPIGLVIPVGVVCVYYLQDRNLKNLFFAAAFGLLLLIFSMVFLLSIAHDVGGHEFVHDVLRMEIVGRMDQSRISSYFYFTTGMRDYAISFPLAALVSLGVVYYEQRLHHHTADLKALLKLFGWAIVILLGMSVPGDKKIRYVLAAAPAFALMASYIFIAPKSERFFIWLRWLLIHTFLVFPLILYVGLRLVMAHEARHAINFQINYLLATQVFFGLQAVQLLIYVCFVKKLVWRDTGILLIATSAFAASYLLVVEPIEQYLDRTHEFVVEVETARKHNSARLVFYKETRDGLPIKYLINMPTEELPVFIDNEHELVTYSEPAFFVASEHYYKGLSVVTAAQFRVIARDKLGHVPVVIFTNR